MSYFGRRVVVNVTGLTNVDPTKDITYGDNGNAEVTTTARANLLSVTYESISSQGNEGIAMEGSVKLSVESEEEVSTVTLWNIDPAKMAQIMSMHEVHVTILAGYRFGTEVKEIYTGTVQDVDYKQRGADLATVINMVPGTMLRQQGRIIISMKGEVTTHDVLHEIFKGSSIDAHIPDVVIGHAYSKGYTDSGNRIDMVERALSGTPYSFFIQNNTVIIFSRGDRPESYSPEDTKITTFLDYDSIPKITSNSGLLGVPRPYTEDKGTKTEVRGWKVKSLLNPLLKPATSMYISSSISGVDGLFFIEECSHDFSTHGNKFETNVKVIQRGKTS